MHPSPRQIRSMSTPYSCAIAECCLYKAIPWISMDPFARQGTHTTVSRQPTVLRTSLRKSSKYDKVITDFEGQILMSGTQMKMTCCRLPRRAKFARTATRTITPQLHNGPCFPRN